MASWIYLSVCIIIAFVLEPVNGAVLNTSPSQITIGGSSPTSQLTVSCRPDAPGVTQVFNIEIGKKSSTGSKQAIIRMTNTDSLVQIVDTSLQQRMTVSGSISGSTSSIQFILTDLRCADAASTYYCTTFYLAAEVGGSDEVTTNVTARTYPEQVEIFPNPDRLQYDDGQLLSMRCTARIGNQFDENNLQNLWTWEYRSVENEFSSWQRYENVQNITYDTPISSGDCQYTGASTLVHTISIVDNGKQFRCSVLSADYSANKTVYILGQTGPGTPSPGGPSTGEAGVDGGMIAGIVVAILVVIVIIIVVIVVMRKRNAGGEHYETKEEDGRDERPEMTPNVVYSTPASYDQREDDDKKDRNANAEGLHYADLDLARLPEKGEPRGRQKDAPTEYASIRLF